jgi:predicted SAM-dependent methyltransferase
MKEKKLQHSKRFVLLARIGITLAAVALFSVIRFDVASMLWQKAQAFTKYSVDRYQAEGKVTGYLNTNSVRKLHLGAGGNSKAGWLNTDIEPIRGQVYLDVTERFPIPDGAIHYIYHEHLIEHIPYPQGMAMLKESYRVMAPGGKIRIVTPNLSKFIGLFAEGKSPQAEKYMVEKMAWHDWPVTPDPECYILNQQLREWGHQFVYTPKLLRAGLAAAGFTDIQELVAGKSDDPVFRGIEMRAFSSVREINQFEALVFEAVRGPVPAASAMNKQMPTAPPQ